VIVSEKHRNKGVGELLFSALKDKAEQLGCTMLALDSYTDNFKAHKFFYQQGYIPRGFHFINILDKSKIR
jgi:GNAT superfamily N-acetyltransferase